MRQDVRVLRSRHNKAVVVVVAFTYGFYTAKIQLKRIRVETSYVGRDTFSRRACSKSIIIYQLCVISYSLNLSGYSGGNIYRSIDPTKSVVFSRRARTSKCYRSTRFTDIDVEKTPYNKYTNIACLYIYIRAICVLSISKYNVALVCVCDERATLGRKRTGRGIGSRLCVEKSAGSPSTMVRYEINNTRPGIVLLLLTESNAKVYFTRTEYVISHIRRW